MEWQLEDVIGIPAPPRRADMSLSVRFGGGGVIGGAAAPAVRALAACVSSFGARRPRGDMGLAPPPRGGDPALPAPMPASRLPAEAERARGAETSLRPREDGLVLALASAPPAPTPAADEAMTGPTCWPKRLLNGLGFRLDMAWVSGLFACCLEATRELWTPGPPTGEAPGRDERPTGVEGRGRGVAGAVVAQHLSAARPTAGVLAAGLIRTLALLIPLLELPPPPIPMPRCKPLKAP